MADPLHIQIIDQYDRFFEKLFISILFLVSRVFARNLLGGNRQMNGESWLYVCLLDYGDLPKFSDRKSPKICSLYFLLISGLGLLRGNRQRNIISYFVLLEMSDLRFESKPHVYAVCVHAVMI